MSLIQKSPAEKNYNPMTDHMEGKITDLLKCSGVKVN